MRRFLLWLAMDCPGMGRISPWLLGLALRRTPHKVTSKIVKGRVRLLRWKMWWCDKRGGHHFRIIGLTNHYESTCMKCGYRKFTAYEEDG